MKIDLHFHSTLSDGRKTSSEIIRIAKQKKMDFIACTEHDIINTRFPELAIKAWMKSVEAVEISSYDEKHDQHLHLTCYSKKFSWRIFDVLKASREGRQVKAKKQIDLLRENGFKINLKDFYDFFENKWVNIENINSSHLSSYIFLFKENIELIEKLTWEKLTRDQFIRECLKDEWRYPFVWAVTIPEYEPEIWFSWILAKENDAILSLAHPNWKLTKEKFEERIGHYIEKWINAVEINSKASKWWVKLIMKYQKIYWYILTFWSDCHFKPYTDGEHWDMWDLNPFIDEFTVGVHDYYIQKKLGMMKPMNLPKEFWMDIYDDIREHVESQRLYNEKLALAKKEGWLP